MLEESRSLRVEQFEAAMVAHMKELGDSSCAAY